MAFNRFFLRNRKKAFLIFLFLAPLVPLLLLRVTLPKIHVYDTLSSWVVQPVAETTSNLVGGVRVVWDRYVSVVNAKSENERLLREVSELKQKIVGFEELQRENSRLSKALKLEPVAGHEYVAARVIGQDLSQESQAFFINAGASQGLEPRMAVVTVDGVVGTIKKVFSHTSVFVAASDPTHDLDAYVSRSRARFIVEGRGEPLVGRLKYLDRAEDVMVGDEILSSGLDGVFPKGLLLGWVVRVEKPKTGVTQSAELRMSVDLGRLEEVMVVRPMAAGPATAANAAASSTVRELPL